MQVCQGMDLFWTKIDLLHKTNKKLQTQINSKFTANHITAGDRDRTGTGITTHGILSPGRLPVPPRRHTIFMMVKNSRYA